MKQLLLFTLLLVGGITFSQTKSIAFKSHSGDMAYFNPVSTDKFGLPPMSIDSIIFFNDSTIIEVSSIGGNWHVVKDTVVNHPYFKDTAVSVDSIQKIYYPESTVFVGFEKVKSNEDESSKCAVTTHEDEQNISSDSLLKPKEQLNSRSDFEKKKQDFSGFITKPEDNDFSIAIFIAVTFLFSALFYILAMVYHSKRGKTYSI